LPNANWSSEPAQYTDINQPVNQIYPILDPSVLDTAATSSSFSGVSNPDGIQWDFPGEAGLITKQPGYYPSTTNIAPMPVQWLYILQDGTWSSPTNASGNTVTVANASATNPIVGRIAFWTDDETSKVNVNTASEGSYWDTPKAGTADEMQFAGNPPLQEEFQRLSGHPATTSLSAVFPEILGGTSGFSRWTGTGSVNSSYVSALQAIFGYGAAGSSTSHGLNPRLSWGLSLTSAGSQGGTFPINSYLANYAPQVTTYFPGGYAAPSTYAPTPNTDRLYATADDAFFQPSGAARAGNAAFANYSITAQKVSQRLFFLTADSKAPETTLYETPRVSMWPITWPWPTASYYNKNSPVIRTVPPVPTAMTPSPTLLSSNPCMAYQEQLLAFCSTLNATSSTPSSIYPYYFQRQDPDSPTSDWLNITRNQNLVNYLTNELSDQKASAAYPSAPGIGASLGAKWDADKSGTTDWIVLNCFDYIRSMINQYTLTPNTAPTTARKLLLYAFTAVNYGSSYGEANSFTSAPMNVSLNGNNYTTEGTYPALREAALVFYATQRNTPKFVTPGTSAPGSHLLKDVVSPANWTNLISWNGASGNSQTTQMRMVMLLNFSQMNPGIAGNTTASNGSLFGVYQPVFWVKVSGSSPFQVNGSGINFPLSGGNVVQINPVGTNPIATSPAYASSLFESSNGAAPAVAKMFSDGSSSGSPTVWSLISDPIALSGGPTSFTFNGSKIQVSIYSIDPSGDITKDPTGNSNCLVSTQTLDFSAFNSRNTFNLGAGVFPTPIAPYWNVRQAPMEVLTPPATISTPVTTTQEATPPATTVVTGGVLMPYFKNTTPGNWQAEIVPIIGELGTTLATPAAQWGTTRTGGSTSLDPSDPSNLYSKNSEPLMYAYQCVNASALQLTLPLTPTIATYSSTVFDHRVAELPLSKSTANGIVAANIDNPSYTGLTITGTGQLLFSGTQQYSGLEGYQLITPYDTVVSLVADPTAAGGKTAGDPRLVGRGISGGSVTFSPIDQVLGPGSALNLQPVNPITTITGVFNAASGLSTYQAQYHEMGTAGAYPQITGIKPPWYFGATGTTQMAIRGGSTNSNGLLLDKDDLTAGLGIDSNAQVAINPNWDWTRLPGNFADGGFLLRPDQEYQSLVPRSSGSPLTFFVPYFSEAGLVNTYAATTSNTSADSFSPNREVPSPVIFGTLPDSMTTGWQTLNFCPNPAITMNSSAPHPGMGTANSPSASGAAYSSAPDHLLLDLFWMPVAEPYPISEEFSTAGKINLNYAMMPFPYIQRKTALDALLKSVWITAMPSPAASANAVYFPSYAKSYGLLHQNSHASGMDLTHTRYPINVNATLMAFDYKFQQGDIFRVASQVCDMFLYPNDPKTPNTLWAGDTNTKGISAADTPPSTSNIAAWWAANSFTADNEREAPYSAIYSRVTTKSNTYTVHWRVQTLHKTPGVATTWTEGTDKVTSELRGSTLIERHIDPNATLPDYATGTPGKAGEPVQPLSYYYKWGVDSETYFQPSP